MVVIRHHADEEGRHPVDVADSVKALARNVDEFAFHDAIFSDPIRGNFHVHAIPQETSGARCSIRFPLSVLARNTVLLRTPSILVNTDSAVSRIRGFLP